MKKINKLLETMDRTEANIRFYLDNEKNNSLLNEIGVYRGLIYAYEILTKEDYILNEWEKEIFKLQVDLKKIDDEVNICQKEK